MSKIETFKNKEKLYFYGYGLGKSPGNVQTCKKK